MTGHCQSAADGDAVSFLVSPRFKHKATDVAGTVPRVGLVGWFQREPQYTAMIPRTRMRTR